MVVIRWTNKDVRTLPFQELDVGQAFSLDPCDDVYMKVDEKSCYRFCAQDAQRDIVNLFEPKVGSEFGRCRLLRTELVVFGFEYAKENDGD